MNLENYLKNNNISSAEFGRMIGLKSRSSVIRYIKGDRIPSKDVMMKIKEVTRGKVTAESFYEKN